MADKVIYRKDVPEKLTWDLSLIYGTEEEMYRDARRMEELGSRIAEAYRGRLDTPENIRACLTAYREVCELWTLVGNYCDLAVSVDYYDTHNQERYGKIQRRISVLMSSLSFIDSEIMDQEETVIEKAMATDGSVRGYLQNLLQWKAHRLHGDTERAMTALSQTLNAPYDIYNAAKLADMRFDPFEADGKEYPLSYSLFEENYEYEPDTNVRRAAFAAFSGKIREYGNVTAAAYNTQVQTEKTIASLRGFGSVFDALLFPQKVSQELYHRQIDLIMEKLAPHMRRYAELIRRVHGLDRMTYADLKLPVDPFYAPEITIEESKKYIEKGLAVYGEEYVEMIRAAYEKRWIDFAQNQGKSTGGFCASPGHFRLCNGAQSIFDTDVSTYFVEAPSTINELLMAHYLLKTNQEPRFRRWVLSCMISNTYYHNFVTHLMEAAYQREVYKIIDDGGSVNAETLNGIMRDTLQKFWGDTVELTDGAELTWMRQPHYYMGLYSYTYSAGLAIATQMCGRIEREGESAVEDWKKVLAAGSTKAPVELAAMAGIDITTDGPLLDTIETIGGMIDEICRLTEELQQ